MWLVLIAHPAVAQNATSTPLPSDSLPAAGIIPEPAILTRFINASDSVIVDREERNDGPYAQIGQIATGAGWLSVGPGYHHQLLSGRAVFDISAAVSWRLYRAGQARFELLHLAHGRLSIGTQVTYQALLQVNYVGLGDRSEESARSAYRFNNLDVLGGARVRATNRLSVAGRIGWMPRPNLSTATGRNVTVPNTIDRYSESSAPGLRTPPAFLHSDISLVADWRDHPGHPTRGGLYRATGASYSDRDSGTYSFRRLEIEASQFIPLFTRKWILALHGWEMVSDASAGHTVPFYLLPSLGGQNTLRSYYDYRFHDNDMQAFNAEMRWSLFTHMDAAAFADLGKVARRASDLDLHDLKRSYGIGFRVHNAASTVFRVDAGHGDEGWRVFFKLSDPFFKRSPGTFTGSAVVPFVP
jgi:hypothetical protein